MKKRLFLLLSLILVLGLLAGCSSKAPAEEGEAGAAAGDGIKIGVNYEKSGEVATYGQASIDGIQMAIDEINAAGGVLGQQVELLIQDNKSDPGEAYSIATKLMTQEGVVACLGPATSGSFKATIPAATQNQVPIISASATADKEVTTDKDGNVNEYVFRLCFNDSFQGVTMANFALNNLKAKSAVIYQDQSSDYAIGLAENFKKTFTEAGGTIVAEAAFVAKDKDFKATLTGFKDKKFDVIFLPGYYSEAGLVIKQARELGISAPILGADGFDSPVLKELAGPQALNNVYFSNHYSSLDQDPAVIKFIEDFKAKFGTEPNAFHALGYDLGKYIADAVARAGAADAQKVTEALASTVDFKGITGTFSMGEDHNPIKSIVVIGLENGDQKTTVRVDP
jgi:branched-chain amino acid transport system substrate-binding protein